jgi:hypothetical protein
LRLDSLLDADEPETPDDDAPEGESKSLAERFGVPPFSVLDARQGYWQDRKRAWLSLGIQSELGRGGGVDVGRLAAGHRTGAELLPQSEEG